MSFPSIPSDWVAALIISLVAAVGNKLWNRASANTKAKITAALGEAKSIMIQCVHTARPGMTVDEMIVQLKGVAAIQLARIGLKNDNPLVSALVNQLIAEGIELFVKEHPAKTSLSLPVHAKLATIANAAR